MRTRRRIARIRELYRRILPGSRQRRASCAQRGFTLLELLITLSITTVGLIGLLALHLSVSRGNDGASRAAEAQQLTVSELETLRGMTLQQLFDDDNTTGPANALPRTRSQTLTGRNGLQYQVTSTVTEVAAVSANVMKIRVVTSWAEDGAALGADDQFDHSLALEVLRTFQEAL